MTRRRQKALAVTAFVLYVGAVLFLCFWDFTPSHPVRETLLGLPADKVVHFCMFFPFPLLAYLAFDRYTERPMQSVAFVLAAFGAGCLVAAATESGQSLTDYRSGDLLDFAADVAALVLSSLLVLAIDIKKMKI